MKFAAISKTFRGAEMDTEVADWFYFRTSCLHWKEKLFFAVAIHWFSLETVDFSFIRIAIITLHAPVTHELKNDI